MQLKGLKMQFTLAHDIILISVLFLFFVKEKPGSFWYNSRAEYAVRRRFYRQCKALPRAQTAFARELGIRPQRKF
ncbi:hypothetical protein NIA69_05745 [Gemmiger formicilis]|nr:hypothetical protein [Gemmiger formicilis]